MKTITAEELYDKMQKEHLVLLDVRDEKKFNEYHIEGAINIHKTSIFELEDHPEKALPALPKEEEIIVTCTTGNSAIKCATILSKIRYNVVVLEGGLTAWKEYLKLKE